MVKADRKLLFVGSYPASNAHQAMQEMVSVAPGTSLLALPDGETGVRNNWVRDEVTALTAGHPALTVAEYGKNYTDWDDLPKLTVTDESAFTADSLRVRLSYAHDAREAQLVLGDLRWQGLAVDTPLQVGMPAPLDLTVSVVGGDGLAYQPLFHEALAGHIRDVHLLDPAAVIQLETPVALNLVNMANPHMPPAMQPEAISQSMIDLAASAPSGTRFGVHFCFGDLNNEGRIETAVAQPSVRFARRLLDDWPADRPLTYIHAPLASGKNPPALTRDTYAPLAELGDALPQTVRFVAGIAHESQPLDEQRHVLEMVEDALGRQADIAAACGLGRRALVNARLVARRMAELALA